MLPLAVLALTLVQLNPNAYVADSRFQGLAEALNLAYRERILVGRPDDAYMSRGTGRLPSRFEYAVALHAITENGIRLSDEALAMPGDDVGRASLLRFASLLPTFARAGREFRKEFDALGVPAVFGLAHLADQPCKLTATSPVRGRLFSDVPAGHWAGKAVGDLHVLGLLDGYPDGRYRG